MSDGASTKMGETTRRGTAANPLADRTILLVDDEPANIRHVRDGLAEHGYRFREANDGTEALRSLREVRPDLIIMDVEMPRLGGVEVCRIIKANGGEGGFGFIPIILVTARQAAGKVEGLELGADDYLVKPFSVRELVARIGAILRRAKGSESDSSVYDDGRLRIDGRTLRVYVEGDEVKLAKKELELLWMLVRNRPSVVSRDRILSEVWQMAEDVETRTVDAHIRNLRKKIGKERIKTVIGYGYRFEA
jgi:DNA-binding response OmpR family regulator